MSVKAKTITVTPEMAKFLNECLQMAGLTQKELADKSGNQQSWVSRLFGGDRQKIDQEMLSKTIDVLASALEANGDDEKAAAGYLRDIFSSDEALHKTADMAIREMVIAALVGSGLGVTREQAEAFYDRPLVETRLDDALEVLSSASAALKARQ